MRNQPTVRVTTKYIVPVARHFFCPGFRKTSSPMMRSRGGHFDFYRSASLARQRHWHPVGGPYARHHRRKTTLRPALGEQCDCRSRKHPSYQSNHVSPSDETMPRLPVPESSSSPPSSSQLASGVMAKRYKGTAQVSKFIDDEIETLSSS